MKRIGTISQHDNGMYQAIVKTDIFEDGQAIIAESATTCLTPDEAKFWLHGHGVPLSNISLVKC